MNDIRRCLSLIVLVLSCWILRSSWAASHHPQKFLNSIAGSKAQGQYIVEHYCSTCHAIRPMIQLGAPRMGDQSDWKPRMTFGIQRLFKHTDEGLNAMPARGGCFECTDHQLMLAILAMLPHEKR